MTAGETFGHSAAPPTYAAPIQSVMRIARFSKVDLHLWGGTSTRQGVIWRIQFRPLNVTLETLQLQGDHLAQTDALPLSIRWLRGLATSVICRFARVGLNEAAGAAVRSGRGSCLLSERIVGFRETIIVAPEAASYPFLEEIPGLRS
jgi:hypothetical protein